jgi:hypothetical protein
MIAPQPHRRRRRDAPLLTAPTTTLHHGSNAQCPDVQAGKSDRCHGHRIQVGPEGPAEHARNVLMLLRLALEEGEPMVGNGCPGVVVPIQTLARIQARAELIVEQLELDGSACCLYCGGSILPPSIGGVPRGTCHCPSNLGRDGR